MVNDLEAAWQIHREFVGKVQTEVFFDTSVYLIPKHSITVSLLTADILLFNKLEKIENGEG